MKFVQLRGDEPDFSDFSDRLFAAKDAGIADELCPDPDYWEFVVPDDFPVPSGYKTVRVS